MNIRLLSRKHKRYVLISFLVVFFVTVFSLFFIETLKGSRGGPFEKQKFTIEQGESFGSVRARLVEVGLLRHPWSFSLYGWVSGYAWNIKPGKYTFDPSLSIPALFENLVEGSHRKVIVRIIPGSSIYDIDDVLEKANVLDHGAFASYAKDQDLEGKLLPDTYFFFTDSSVSAVAQKMIDNFVTKTATLFQSKSLEERNRILIIASLIEKEVPTIKDQRLVAGIIEKRIVLGMPLQIDATICYIKRITMLWGYTGCYPLTRLDFQNKSPYNTYLHKGLPPGPIGNPGLNAISAAANPQKSSYLFYLSDPATRKTIFSNDFDQHRVNRQIYLP